MKTRVLIALFLLAVGSQSYITTADKCLNIFIVPTFQKQYLEECTLTLYRDNQKEQILERPNFRNKYAFALAENTIYTVIVWREGFHPRKISIDTSLPVNIDLSQLFSFTGKIEMIPLSVTLNSDMDDFPIALISYNEKADIFSISEKYTKLVKKGLFDKMRSN